MIDSMQTPPATGRMCSMCNTHLATMTLDLSELRMPVPLCGKCALELIPWGKEKAAPKSTHTGG